MTSFLKKLEAKGKPVIDIILEHPIIESLCPTNPSSTTKLLSTEELITVRNNFYVQDYLFLILGYELSRNVLLIGFGDEAREQDIDYIRETLGLLGGIRSPIEGSSIDTLRIRIQENDISFNTKSINSATQEYIVFKVDKSLEGINETLVVSFACIFTYYKIWEKFYLNRDQIKKDKELKIWISILFDDSIREYYEQYATIFNYISVKITDKEKKYLANIFLQACQFEYRFFDELFST